MIRHICHFTFILALAVGIICRPCVCVPEALGEQAAEQSQRVQGTGDTTSLPPGAIVRFGTTQRANERAISVTFLPDSQTIATTDRSGDLIFRDARTGKE